MNSELQERLFDDMLTSALGECIEMEEPELLTEDEMRAAGLELPEVSARFYRKMNRFNRKRKRKLWLARNQKRVNALAATFLIVFIGFGIAACTVDAVRIPVQKFFVELGGYFAPLDGSEINIGNSSDDLVIPEEYAAYIPSYVPDGFSLVNVESQSSMITLEYENDSGDYYVLQFWPAAPDSFVDGENTQLSSVEIQGSRAVISAESDRLTITWMPDGRKYSVSGYLSEPEAIAILESVKK